ncbi:MAG: DNA alkylation repair protein [Methyloprofundus sp.]|nr:DNA alkylation repair protein [Methyloprofundus sp.]
MPEPFKNLFSYDLSVGIARHFKRQDSKFDALGFINAAVQGLDNLELKERSQQITQAMVDYLPADFEQAGQIILASLGSPLEDELLSQAIDDKGIAGWAAIMPISDYVGLQGRRHFELSMILFKEMTKRGTAEFGIRYFLLKYPEKTLAELERWTDDENQHVRRLVSEGTRPRLPWAMALPGFKKEPFALINLLEKLKDDNAEYVRRSVANNLNDIAKDHPDLVAKTAEEWLKGASEERKKLIKHACRTLLKQGHQHTLQVLGYQSPQIKQLHIEIQDTTIIFGNALQFSLSLCSNSDEEQALMIDYIIHHQKANGTTTAKVFKWRNINLAAQQSFQASKKHAIKKISTRQYYAGLHGLEIVVNGVSMGRLDFQLVM